MDLCVPDAGLQALEAAQINTLFDLSRTPRAGLTSRLFKRLTRMYGMLSQAVGHGDAGRCSARNYRVQAVLKWAEMGQIHP